MTGGFRGLHPNHRSMAVRPPQNDTDEPDSLEFGIAALDGRLESRLFPATSEELVRELGDPEVPYDAADHTLALSAALDRVDADRFETKNELLRALHPVFERERERGSGGVLGRLRSLLPF